MNDEKQSGGNGVVIVIALAVLGLLCCGGLVLIGGVFVVDVLWVVPQQRPPMQAPPEIEVVPLPATPPVRPEPSRK